MKFDQLYFIHDVSKTKPENIIHRTNECPFCDVGSLTEIIEKEDDIIWLINKYPTLQNAFQTVIIESSDCEAHIPTYSHDYMRKVMRFAISRWLEFNKKKEFQSVALFKNHGPLSGGSIKHPHMQIVGLKDIDYRSNVVRENFQGLLIFKQNGLEINISSQPIMGTTEFNIILDHMNLMNSFSDYIQIVINYVLTDFLEACSSYNMFFYYIDDKIICKIIPRFVVSPFFVGYKIPLVSVESPLIVIKENLLKRIYDYQKLKVNSADFSPIR